MSVSNGIFLPYNLANGQEADATLVMANLNTLLGALNRALLDAGSGNGISAGGSQLRNLADGSLSTDAASFGQLTNAVAGCVPLTGGTMTGELIVPQGVLTVGRPLGDNTTFAANTGFVQTALGNLLNTAVFTSSPLMPTAALGDNTTKGATTAFIRAALAAFLTATTAVPGKLQLAIPGGPTLVLQWLDVAYSITGHGYINFSWPSAFANGVLFYGCCAVGLNGGGGVVASNMDTAPTVSGGTLVVDGFTYSASGNVRVYALGY